MKPLRIAFSCPALSGHLNPALTLASELQRRGHYVVLAAFADAEPKARAAGVPFCPVAAKEFPKGTLPEIMSRLGALSGFAASRYTVDFFRQEGMAYLGDLPRVWQSERIDGAVVDQLSVGAATAAQTIKLPYVSIANALWISRDKNSPPWFSYRQYHAGIASRWRNRLAHAPLQFLIALAARPINVKRRQLGLPPISHRDWGESSLAVIAQQPPGFEFPEVPVPDHVHFTGPFHRVGTREDQPFPWERLNGRPLVYTSLGTIQNRLLPVFRTIAEACAGLDVQLVTTLGVKDSNPPRDWPGDPIVVPFAPQLELLARAALVITHAGLNTALESLAQGVPMVAIPIANDQPGVAARLVRLGAAELVPLAQLSAERVRAAVTTVLANPRYREAARGVQGQIAGGQGLLRAAEIVERALTCGKSITNQAAPADRAE